MMCNFFTSQKGFSLVRILIALVILGIAVLYFLPTPIGGGPFEIVNQLSNKAKSVINGLISRVANVGTGLADRWDSIKASISAKLKDLSDRWNLTQLSELISGVAGFKLTEQSLEKLEDEGLPVKVLDDLEVLEGEEFTKEDEFLDALEEEIGEEQTAEYKDRILKHTTLTVEDKWKEDMNKLVKVSKARGFKMPQTERRQDQFKARKASWKRVENEFWNEIREQTETTITKNIGRFRTRPLGCSDFTVEMRKIWEIGENFNQDTWEGYVTAKMLSEELLQPRSERFITEFMDWLAVANMYSSRSGNRSGDPFIRQLNRAIMLTADGQIPDYPHVIKELDSRPNLSPYSVDHILRDIVIAEIYVNYDLINPAEDRFDEAIRNLSALVARYQHDPYSLTSLGLHMALGLLHERVCKNADLAIKEFKEVVAIAKRLGLSCKDYSIVHYHLGVINLNLRIGPQAKPVFEEKKSSYSKTTKEILTATPTPIPYPTAVPTATPKPLLKLTKTETSTTEYVLSRKIQPGERPERPPTDEPTPGEPETTPTPPTPPTQQDSTRMYYKYGTILPGQTRRLERDIRLRPRAELGETVTMKKFNVNDLYDLSKIPDDAVREFELYLKCITQGDRVDIARFIHQKYMGK